MNDEGGEVYVWVQGRWRFAGHATNLDHAYTIASNAGPSLQRPFTYWPGCWYFKHRPAKGQQ